MSLERVSSTPAAGYHAAMPRTHSELKREVKVGALVEAAERRLREGGYEALSVAGIARELGLAQNAVYWYFPTKDHLFVAALQRLSARLIKRKPRQRPVVEEIVWFVDRLSELQAIRRALDERARVSLVVRDFEHDHRAGMRAMLRNAIAGSVVAADLDTVTDALLATLEGVLLLRLARRERDRIVRFTFSSLVSQQTGATRMD